MNDCLHDNIAVVTRRSSKGVSTDIECEDCGAGFVPRGTAQLEANSGYPFSAAMLKEIVGAAGMGHRWDALSQMVPAEVVSSVVAPTMRKLTVDAARASKCQACTDDFEHPFRGEVHMHPDGVFYLPYEDIDMGDKPQIVVASGS